MMRYFYFNPVTQYENIGDLLINKSLLGLLRPYGRIIIDDRNKPAGFINELYEDGDQLISTIGNLSGHDFITKSLKNRDADSSFFYVYVPGDMARQGFKRALLGVRHFYKVRSLKRLGCNFIRLGISLGNFDFSNLILESLYTRNYLGYGLRDSLSVSKAKLFRFANVTFFPDLAWAYSADVNGYVPQETTTPYVILSFRANGSGKQHDSEYLRMIGEKLKGTLAQCAPNNIKVLLTYQVHFDRQACFELKEMLSPYFNVEVKDSLLSLDEASKLYKNASLILSNRLHVLLLGKISGCLSIPFINFRDNKKIVGIYKDNGLAYILVNYAEDDASVSSKLASTIARREAILADFERKKNDNIVYMQEKVQQIFNDSSVQ